MLGLGRTWRESDVATLLLTLLKFMILVFAIPLSIDFLHELGEVTCSF
jgi:hypothetical protein